MQSGQQLDPQLNFIKDALTAVIQAEAKDFSILEISRDNNNAHPGIRLLYVGKGRKKMCVLFGFKAPHSQGVEAIRHQGALVHSIYFSLPFLDFLIANLEASSGLRLKNYLPGIPPAPPAPIPSPPADAKPTAPNTVLDAAREKLAKVKKGVEWLDKAQLSATEKKAYRQLLVTHADFAPALGLVFFQLNCVGLLAANRDLVIAHREEAQAISDQVSNIPAGKFTQERFAAIVAGFNPAPTTAGQLDSKPEDPKETKLSALEKLSTLTSVFQLLDLKSQTQFFVNKNTHRLFKHVPAAVHLLKFKQQLPAPSSTVTPKK